MSIYLSVSKYLEESAKSSIDGADQIVRHTREIIKKTHDKVTIPDECNSCQCKIPYFDISSLTNKNKCRICSKSFCNNCLIKSNFDIPNRLLDITFQNKTKVNAEKQLICKQNCLLYATKLCMESFCADIRMKFEENMNSHLNCETLQKYFYPIPKECPEDTAYRKAIRAAHIAGYVADLTGYSFTYKAIKYAYYSGELINILTEGGMLAVLNPLLEQLKIFGISGPTALIRLYYLGCQHTLNMKVNKPPRYLEYQPDQPGVLLSECPYSILEYVKQYLSPAQWQYCSNLPPPHHENDWGNWYLSQLIRRQGWTLILSVNESTKLPNGFKCPAFALVSRCYNQSSSKHSTESVNVVVKECMLIIRGSKSTLDWSINLGEAMDDFSFTRLVSEDNLQSNTHSTLTVSGNVHKGIYNAAIAILDCYNLKSYLIRMLESDYQLKVVGHSLGAGVSVIIAAEMRSTLISLHAKGISNVIFMEVPTLDLVGNQATKEVPIDGSSVNPVVKKLIDNISAIVFSCPACITINLADAFLADKLLINTIYDMDVIPRFSFKTLEILSEELKDPEFIVKADNWTTSDKTAFGEYASSMGKAGNIIKAVSTTLSTSGIVNTDQEEDVISATEEVVTTNEISNDDNNNTNIQDKQENKELDSTSEDKGTTLDNNTKKNTNISSVASTIDVAKGWLSKYRGNISESNHVNSSEQLGSTVNITDINDNNPKGDLKSNTKKSEPLPSEKIPRIQTVTPGPIVHLYAENNGKINAAVVTYMHKSFERMTIIPSYITEDHFIPRTREALRTVLYNNRNHKTIKDTNKVFYDKYFNIPINFDGSDPYNNMHDKLIKTNHLEYEFSSIQTKVIIDDGNTINGDKKVMMEDINTTKSTIIPSVDKTIIWEPCSVCGIDVTWPYVLNSDASRAIVTHNCKCCGKVVCSLCSPSGDSLPGDGLNQSYPLSDYRITLPHLGIFSPQRVCLHCYFDA